MGAFSQLGQLKVNSNRLEPPRVDTEVDFDLNKVLPGEDPVLYRRELLEDLLAARCAEQYKLRKKMSFRNTRYITL